MYSIDFTTFKKIETDTYITTDYVNNVFYNFCSSALLLNKTNDEYMIILITGRPGTGKSTVAIQAAVYAQKLAFDKYKINYDFDMYNIFFDINTFFEEISKRKNIKNNIFILDDPEIGVFLTSTNTKFNDFLRTVRTENILLIITLPSTKDLPLLTVKNYIKIIFYIEKRNEKNEKIIIPKKTKFQPEREYNTKEKKETEYVTAEDLLIEKCQIHSIPFNIPKKTIIKKIVVPAITEKDFEILPLLSRILKNYTTIREQKPKRIIKNEQDINININIVDEKKEYIDKIEKIAEEIITNEKYRKLIITPSKSVNKEIIKTLFNIDNTTARIIKNICQNKIKNEGKKKKRGRPKKNFD